MPSKLSIQQSLEILGLERGVTLKELKRAYRRRVRACHPDLNPTLEHAESELKLVVQAYHVLERRLPERSEKLDMAFTATRRTPEQTGIVGDLEVAPGEVPFGAILGGAVAGVLVAVVVMVLSGGVDTVAATPYPLWAHLGLALLGALLALVLVRALAPARHTMSEAVVLLLGAAGGLLTSFTYIGLMDRVLMDPARAWMILALACGGGLAAGVWQHSGAPGVQAGQDTKALELLPPERALAMGVTVLVTLQIVTLGLFGLWYASVAFTLGG